MELISRETTHLWGTSQPWTAIGFENASTLSFVLRVFLSSFFTTTDCSSRQNKNEKKSCLSKCCPQKTDTVNINRISTEFCWFKRLTLPLMCISLKYLLNKINVCLFKWDDHEPVLEVWASFPLLLCISPHSKSTSVYLANLCPQFELPWCSGVPLLNCVCLFLWILGWCTASEITFGGCWLCSGHSLVGWKSTSV